MSAPESRDRRMLAAFLVVAKAWDYADTVRLFAGDLEAVVASGFVNRAGGKQAILIRQGRDLGAPADSERRPFRRSLPLVLMAVQAFTQGRDGYDDDVLDLTDLYAAIRDDALSSLESDLKAELSDADDEALVGVRFDAPHLETAGQGNLAAWMFPVELTLR